MTVNYLKYKTLWLMFLKTFTIIIHEIAQKATVVTKHITFMLCYFVTTITYSCKILIKWLYGFDERLEKA